MTTLNEQYSHAEYAISFSLYGDLGTSFAEYCARRDRYHRDRAYQSKMNCFWDNNPGELDRWADDGGRVP